MRRRKRGQHLIQPRLLFARVREMQRDARPIGRWSIGLLCLFLRATANERCEHHHTACQPHAINVTTLGDASVTTPRSPGELRRSTGVCPSVRRSDRQPESSAALAGYAQARRRRHHAQARLESPTAFYWQRFLLAAAARFVFHFADAGLTVGRLAAHAPVRGTRRGGRGGRGLGTPAPAGARARARRG